MSVCQEKHIIYRINAETYDNEVQSMKSLIGMLRHVVLYGYYFFGK
jgi:hypothetical protein